MKAVTVGWITFLEVIRNRILYGLIFFAIFLMGFSIALGELTIDERERLTANMSLTSIHLVMMVICVFLGCSVMVKELEKRTYMTILTRPISREQFLVGKFLGLFSLVAIVVFFLMVISKVVLWGTPYSMGAWATMYLGFLLEAMILIALALFMSVLAQFFVAVVASIGIFFIGHWLENLAFFARQSKSDLFQAFAKFMDWITPHLNFEEYNWRSMVHGYFEPRSILFSVTHALGWTVILLVLASLIFRKKDLV